jgi:hypothetical protein
MDTGFPPPHKYGDDARLAWWPFSKSSNPRCLVARSPQPGQGTFHGDSGSGMGKQSWGTWTGGDLGLRTWLLL